METLSEVLALCEGVTQPEQAVEQIIGLSVIWDFETPSGYCDCNGVLFHNYLQAFALKTMEL